MEKYKIIAIMGKSGSGKDTLLNAAIQAFPDLNKIIMSTTRPKRENEKDGVHYHFRTDNQIVTEIYENKILTAQNFREWVYAVPIYSLSKDKINIGVFSPEDLSILEENHDVSLSIVYLDVSDKTRLLRCLNREDNPDCYEIVRRFMGDKKDFEILNAKVQTDYLSIDEKVPLTQMINIIGEIKKNMI